MWNYDWFFKPVPLPKAANRIKKADLLIITHGKAIKKGFFGEFSYREERISRTYFGGWRGNRESGQAAHFVSEHVPELLGNMFTPWGQAAGYLYPAKAE
jgi:hypothetical protein